MRIIQACKPFPAIRAPDFKCNASCSIGCSDLSKCQHAYYKCYVYVDDRFLKSGWTRDRIISEINELGVPCYQGTCSEVYLEKAFEGTGFIPKNRLAIAKDLGESSLMFLVHPTLTSENIDQTVAAITAVFKRASA